MADFIFGKRGVLYKKRRIGTRQTVPVTVANTGNTDYLYTGKESQNALFGINWYDSGARFQTTDGIFTGDGFGMETDQDVKCIIFRIFVIKVLIY